MSKLQTSLYLDDARGFVLLKKETLSPLIDSQYVLLNSVRGRKNQKKFFKSDDSFIGDSLSDNLFEHHNCAEPSSLKQGENAINGATFGRR